MALDRHLWEAHARGDWRESAKFYAPEFHGVSVAGESDRAAAIESVKDRRVADWRIRDVAVVRLSKDAAVLTYIYSCKVLSPQGRVVETRQDHRVSFAWAQRNGGWVLVYSHDEHAAQPAATYSRALVDYYRAREERRKAKKEPPDPRR